MRIAACTRSHPAAADSGDAFLAAVVEPAGRLRCLLRSDTPGSSSLVTLAVDTLEPVLLAVVDGVGHGGPARHAATLVLDSLLDDGSDLPGLVSGCHRRAVGSRGATLGLALLTPQSRRISVVGVGDVRVELGGAVARSFAMNNGTLGHNLPPQPLVETGSWGPGAVLFMCTDGIAEAFGVGTLPAAEAADPRAAVAWIVRNYGRKTDDATALFVRHG